MSEADATQNVDLFSGRPKATAVTTFPSLQNIETDQHYYRTMCQFESWPITQFTHKSVPSLLTTLRSPP